MTAQAQSLLQTCGNLVQCHLMQHWVESMMTQVHVRQACFFRLRRVDYVVDDSVPDCASSCTQADAGL